MQATRTMLLFNRDIQNYFLLLNKTTNVSHQEKVKRNNTNSKVTSRTRYDKAMNVRTSDNKVGDKIFVKQ